MEAVNFEEAFLTTILAEADDLAYLSFPAKTTDIAYVFGTSPFAEYLTWPLESVVDALLLIKTLMPVNGLPFASLSVAVRYPPAL